MKMTYNYQHVPGTPMSPRDEQEVGSRFWNKGKWDNFVLPWLPEDCNEMTLVDVGCNAGLFLKLAEDKGFEKVIGLEPHVIANQRATAYKKENGGKYTIHSKHLEEIYKKLPVVDYMVMANVHYYISIDHWLDITDHLISKVRNFIIVTAEKQRAICKASGYPDDLRRHFKCWEEIGFIDGEKMLEGDPFPRPLKGLCFKNPYLERLPIKDITCENKDQRDFYKQLDEGVFPEKTRYLERLLKRKGRIYSTEKLERYVQMKSKLYEDIKQYGVRRYITINKKNVIVDGNHKYGILKHLGYKTCIVRYV